MTDPERITATWPASYMLRTLAVLLLIPSVMSGDDHPDSGLHDGALDLNGEQRTYHCYVSTRFDHATSRALVIVLHGGGGRGLGMRALTHQRFEHLADRDDGVIVYPDAVDSTWNDGRTGMSDHPHRDAIDDVGFLKRLVSDLTGAYAIDPKRVFLTGMSNGAIMSYRVANDAPGLLAATAPVCGCLPICEAPWTWATPTPVLLFAGDADPLVPFEGGAVHVGTLVRGQVASQAQTVQFLITRNHAAAEGVSSDLPDTDPADGTRVQHVVHAAGPGGAEVSVYVVQGGGHTWPGGLQYLPERSIGKTCRDIDACDTIWAFFHDHPRP